MYMHMHMYMYMYMYMHIPLCLTEIQVCMIRVVYSREYCAIAHSEVSIIPFNSMH